MIFLRFAMTVWYMLCVFSFGKRGYTQKSNSICLLKYYSNKSYISTISTILNSHLRKT